MASDASTAGAASPNELAFSVDTHLLRELGALLVGRNSTAVVELIKNAYDADATHVVLHGEALGENGSVSITDDGHGMTYEDFVTKFLRIAGRSKEGGVRRSPKWRRRYTGAKGIGRLSSHKLGTALTLESVPDLSVLERTLSDSGVRADIDWLAIEQSDASIDETREIRAMPTAASSAGDTHGTNLTIGRLHAGWTPAQLSAFLSEVRSTRADRTLTEPVSKDVFPGEHLLSRIDVSDTSDDDPGFSIELSGDFAGSESQWPTLLAHVTWMIEIDARDKDDATVQITPSRATRKENSTAETRTFVVKRSEDGPGFVARVFVRDQSAGRGRRLPDLVARFARDAAGIRLFFEGFRVLPYGSPRNDWLGLDDDYSVRRALDLGHV